MSTTQTIADAPPDNWVDRYAPVFAQPFLKLMRADRPIGTWLLLFPCWWSQALAENSLERTWPNIWFLALFALGAWVMRGAGCTYNDVVDRDYDGRVARTAARPIPSGQVSARRALWFAIALSLVGLLVLIQFNSFTIALAIASLALVAIYPFMKRITSWPQVVLGLVFNWGALVGWSATTGGLDWPPVMLYAGAVLWTIGYDTIYAHQDKDDDALLGLGSTALRFGDTTPYWLSGFYAGAGLMWAIAGAMAGATFVFFACLLLVAAHFTWQIATLDTADSDNCLQRFRANRHVGWLVFLGLIADMSLLGPN